MSNQLITILLIVNSAGFVALAAFVAFAYKKYRKILSGVNGKSLEKILISHIERVDKVASQNLEMEKSFEEFKKFSRNFLYKIGFKRFNPFNNTGGDQSFALAILDDKGDGIVISSMHAREGTRMYAKPVKGGKEFQYRFSQEEKDVVGSALK